MAKDKGAQPKVSPWDTWVNRLSPLARERMTGEMPVAPPGPPVQPDEYTDWVDRLSPTARKELGKAEDTQSEVVVPEDDLRWGIVESFSGDYPVCRMFKTPELLAKYVGTLERQDVAVWCFYGKPMRITVGPQRYLLLPDGKTAVQIPMYQGGPCKRIAADLVDATAIQDDGFLGHPALLEAPIVATDTSSDNKEETDDDEEEAGV